MCENLHCTRVITPKRGKKGGAHIRSLAPGQRSEETSQRRQTAGNNVSIRLTRELNPRPPAMISRRLTTELTGRSS